MDKIGQKGFLRDSHHCPGARVNFRSDAIQIHFGISYLQLETGTGIGKFLLEVDGLLQPGFLGSDTDSGEHWYTAFTQIDPIARDFSLVFPFARSVDFLGLEIEGGTASLLAPAPERPAFLYVAYGDSITHGFRAYNGVGSTYPYLVGENWDYKTINMGFAGQVVHGPDGTAVGLLYPDRVTVAIGTNNYAQGTSEAQFKAEYNAFLDNLRSFEPASPVYCLTPTWVSYEGVPHLGQTVEDYRQHIRDVVFVRQSADDNLYLIEGRDMVPPGIDFFPDGIHPNDAGFAHYATNLSKLNLVRNWGFEVDELAWEDWGNSSVVGTGVHAGSFALRVGPGAGGRGQVVGGLSPGRRYRLDAWGRIEAPGEQAWFGITFSDAFGQEIAEHHDRIVSTSYSSQALQFVAPPDFARVTVWCWKNQGAANFYIDDYCLSEAPPLLSLATGELHAGQYADFDLTGGTPNSLAVLVFGTQGSGTTYVAQLNVVLDLAQPSLAGSPGLTNSQGEVSWSLMVPPGAAGVDVWLQAAQVEAVSNINRRLVQ